VLVPGGKFFLMEHVVDNKLSLIRIAQMISGITGICQFLFDGCRPDKDIQTDVSKAGFASTDIKRFRLDLSVVPPGISPAVYLIEPHIYGTATAAK